MGEERRGDGKGGGGGGMRCGIIAKWGKMVGEWGFFAGRFGGIF